MEYEEENDVQCGAIFMSNITTKRECFRRRLFGLPSAQANFVKQIKAGIVLFLFEFERRELFGVYRASSDGAMNIVPHSFSSSGKQFPAQVRFTPIWHCSPLSENEFRDAIRDNYFSAKKFKFGLSEDQVRRLLCLFSSRKLKNKLPPRQLTREFRSPMGMDRRSVDDDRSVVSERIETEPDEGYGFSPANLSKDPGVSFGRTKIIDDRSFKDCMVENEHKLDGGPKRDLTDFTGDSVGKRRIENARRLLMSDVTKNEDYDDVSRGRGIWSEYHQDSSSKVKRVAEEGWSLRDDKIENERRMDNNLGPLVPAEYPGSSFDKVRQVAEDGRFLMRDRIGHECSLDRGFGQVVSTEHIGKPFSKVRHATEDGGFSMNHSVENESNMASNFKRVISTGHSGNLLGRVRRATDDNEFVMNARIQNEHHVDGTGTVISTRLLGNTRGGIRKASNDGGLFTRESIETEYKLDTNLMRGTGMSSKHFGKPSGQVALAVDGRRFLFRDRVEASQNVGNSLEPAISTEYFRNALGEDRQVADDDPFRKRFRIEYERDKDNSLLPVISTECTAFHQLKQDHSVYSSKPILETNHLLHEQDRPSSMFARSTVRQNFDLYYPTSHDAIVTRAVPYDPEVPKIDYGCYSDFAVDSGSRSVQDSRFYCVSKENDFSFSKSRSQPYCIDSKGLSRIPDVAFDYGNEVPLASNCHDYSHYETSRSLSNAGKAESRELKASVHDGYRDLQFSEPSLVSMPFLKDEIYARENKGPLSYTFSSIRNSSFTVDNGYPLVSQGKYEHIIQSNQNVEASRVEGFLLSNENRSGLGIHGRGNNSVDCDNKYHRSSGGTSSDYRSNSDNKHYRSSGGTRSDYRSNRTSVFARLTLTSEVLVQKQPENDPHLVYNDHDMDASVDEVMGMLRQGQSNWVKKLRDDKPPVRQLHDKIARNKKQTITNKEYDHTTASAMKMKMDAKQATEESGDQMIRETRRVDFKRSSKMKKNLDDTSRKGSVQVAEGETSIKNADRGGSVGKQCKENGDQMIKETRGVDFKRRSEIQKNLDETSRKGSVQVAEGETSIKNADGGGSVGKQCKENDDPMIKETRGVDFKHWSKIKKYLDETSRKDYVQVAEGETSIKNADGGGSVGKQCNENDDQIFKETRGVDFKRRSKIKKNLDETRRKGSVQVAEGETPIKNTDRGGVADNQFKRRKLVRPVFDKKESSGEGIGSDGATDLQLVNQESSLSKANEVNREDLVGSCESKHTSSWTVGLEHDLLPTSSDGNNAPNMQLFQKSSLSKGNEVNHEDLVRSCESDLISSCNVGLEHDLLPSSSDGNNATAKQSLNFEETRNSAHCGASFKCHESDDEKKLMDNYAISSFSEGDDSKCCGWIDD